MSKSRAEHEADTRAAIDTWAAEQAATAPPLTDQQRAELAPLLDCTTPSFALRRVPDPRGEGEAAGP